MVSRQVLVKSAKDSRRVLLEAACYLRVPRWAAVGILFGAGETTKDLAAARSAGEGIRLAKSNKTTENLAKN